MKTFHVRLQAEVATDEDLTIDAEAELHVTAEDQAQAELQVQEMIKLGCLSKDVIFEDMENVFKIPSDTVTGLDIYNHIVTELTEAGGIQYESGITMNSATDLGVQA